MLRALLETAGLFFSAGRETGKSVFPKIIFSGGLLSIAFLLGNFGFDLAVF
jgi:hypothetical protein